METRILPMDKSRARSRENDLARLAGTGDLRAFSELVEIFKDRLHQFILCIIGPDRETEDLTQEAFIRIYKALPSFRGDCAFSTWAYAVTRNVCRGALRKRGREGDILEDAGEERLARVPDRAPLPGELLGKRETAAIVRAEIEELSPIHRAVLFLNCWEKLSYEEMAQALDIPLGTVRSRLHNALAALSARLRKALPEENRS
ncbi:MAG: sigma-70 family RNA polymerase sigma factor [Elusimicrobiales bacterium]|nr:sigma-70 family RNA polymerase sigma factor [Elusimicrobiales bacterium]